MLETMVESTRIDAIVWSQSVFHSSVGGYLDNTISGVLFSVEK